MSVPRCAHPDCNRPIFTSTEQQARFEFRGADGKLSALYFHAICAYSAGTTLRRAGDLAGHENRAHRTGLDRHHHAMAEDARMKATVNDEAS